MFRTLIYPSSGACDYCVELPHWSIVLGSLCVGVSVWLGWSGIRVAGFTSYVLNMFRILICPSSGALDYSVELQDWSYCSWFDVCWRFGAAGFEWCPCCRLHFLFAQNVPDINISIIRSGIRVAG